MGVNPVDLRAAVWMGSEVGVRRKRRGGVRRRHKGCGRGERRRHWGGNPFGAGESGPAAPGDVRADTHRCALQIKSNVEVRGWGVMVRRVLGEWMKESVGHGKQGRPHLVMVTWAPSPPTYTAVALLPSNRLRGREGQERRVAGGGGRTCLTAPVRDEAAARDYVL
jgi:hypothetical protein